jgi:hypothetical protein
LPSGFTDEPLDRAAQRVKASGEDDVRIVVFDARDLGHVDDVVSSCLDAAGETMEWVLITLGLLGDAAEDVTDTERFAEDPRTVAAAVMKGIERDEPVIWVPSILRWIFLALGRLPQQLWGRLPG